MKMIMTVMTKMAVVTCNDGKKKQRTKKPP